LSGLVQGRRIADSIERKLFTMGITLPRTGTPYVRSSAAPEFANTEEERAERRSIALKDLSPAAQIGRITKTVVACSQIAKSLHETHAAISSLGGQYTSLAAAASPLAEAAKAWQGSWRVQQEHIRAMLEPLAAVRANVLLAARTQELGRLTAFSSVIQDSFRSALGGLSGVSSIASVLAQHVQQAQLQSRAAFESLRLVGTPGEHFRDFEKVYSGLAVSPAILEGVASLGAFENRIGKVALPSIDWGTAAALASVLGKDGLNAQLALLGIESDGTWRELVEVPEKGLLSRRQSDKVGLAGLLLSIISIWMTAQIFFYQQNESATQQEKNDEQAAKQIRQLNSLNRLLERALEQAAGTQERHFVVRARPAAVRSEPDHGATVTGKLLPNEVVRAIDRSGRWVKVEYYHWLHQEYQTGWVLKHYLERVPQNHSKPEGAMQRLYGG
jgi:hypothetical protein